MKFEINFLDLPTHEQPDLDAYKHALMNFDEEAWYGKSTGGAGFVAHEAGSPSWSLVLNPQRGRGISLLTTVYSPTERFGDELVSVATPEKMDEFVTTGQEVVVPSGSFVTPEQAWFAIEDFCANPRVASPRLHWMSTDKLEYPLA